MPEAWGEFGKGFEDETALRHARVRDGEFGRVHDDFAVEEDVDVDDAGSVGDGAFAAELVFDILGGVQELAGEQAGFDFEDLIEEPGLVFEEHGGGFEDGGGAYEFEGRPSEGFDCLLQVVFAVTKVGAEGEVGGFQAHGVVGEGSLVVRRNPFGASFRRIEHVKSVALSGQCARGSRRRWMRVGQIAANGLDPEAGERFEIGCGWRSLGCVVLLNARADLVERPRFLQWTCRWWWAVKMWRGKATIY